MWIDTRPALRSRLSCARRVRMSFARWSASIRWVQGALRGRRVLGGGVRGRRHRAANIQIATAPCKANRRNSPAPRPEVDACSAWSSVDGRFAATFRALGRGTPSLSGRCSRALRELSRVPRRSGRRRADRGSSPCPPRPASRPPRASRAACSAVCDAAHADDRDRDPRARPPRPARARPRGPPDRTARRSRRRATAPGPAAPGRGAMARSVLISETASAPASSAAAATRGDVGGVRA